MSNNVWTINKKYSEGDEFQACGHRVRVVKVLEWQGRQAIAEVKVLGDNTLRFDGDFKRVA